MRDDRSTATTHQSGLRNSHALSEIWPEEGAIFLGRWFGEHLSQWMAKGRKRVALALAAGCVGVGGTFHVHSDVGWRGSQRELTQQRSGAESEYAMKHEWEEMRVGDGEVGEKGVKCFE